MRNRKGTDKMKNLKKIWLDNQAIAKSLKVLALKDEDLIGWLIIQVFD